MDLTADEAVERIEAALEWDRPVFLMLFNYEIGDDYEVPCIATGLTISKEHTIGLQREGNAMRGTAFFPPELVPQNYRDRVNPSGVVPIGIRFRLDAIVSLHD